MYKAYKAIAALISLGLAACSTSQTKLSYSSTAVASKLPVDTPSLYVGTFSDQRGETPTWYGAVRGGFGNPLKKLESDRPIASIVQDAFARGVQARGISPGSSPSTLQLSGVIRKLDCSQMARREATVEIDVVLTETKSGQPRFKQTYSTYNMDGSLMSMKTGIFASVDDLRLTAEKTLNETVDKALDDSAFRAALAATNTFPVDSTSDRLRALEKLHKDGLINDKEFEAKRQEVLNKL